MANSDRLRVERIIGMLGSDFDGERAAAGLLLHRAASARRLTLVEFLKKSLATEKAAPAWRGDGDLLDQLAQAVSFKCALSTWELGFARDVSLRYAHSSQLSQKQRTMAAKIIVKARRAAMAGDEPD